MSLVGNFWTHPNALYYRALVDVGPASNPGTFKGVQDDLTDWLSAIQCYFSFSLVQHLFQRQKLPRDAKQTPLFSIVAVVVFILYFVGTTLAILTFATKLFAATRVSWYFPEDMARAVGNVNCVLGEPSDRKACLLYLANTPAHLSSRLDAGLGAVLQAVIILADGLLVSIGYWYCIIILSYHGIDYSQFA
jgi:hypothetical protein